MSFGHDSADPLRTAVALVNGDEPPETLATVSDLATFYRKHRYTGRLDGDQAELDAVRGIRPVLRALLTASRDDAAAQVNDILGRTSTTPRLTRHDDEDWHLHVWADDAPFAERILLETAIATADLIRADEMSRLSICADETCQGIVLDLSRNRSRRYCGNRCGNRAAVAAYRARKAPAGNER